MKTSYELYRPFGPPLGKFKIPPSIVKKINDFVDFAVIDKVKAKELDVGSGLAGQVTQELALPEEIIQGELVKLFSSFTSDYINGSLGVQIKNFSLLQCWVVRQFKNEYNPVHWHTGHISGAGWLKLPASIVLGFFIFNESLKFNAYFGSLLIIIAGVNAIYGLKNDN